MAAAKFIIIGLQIILSLILIVVVLFQSGSQRGLSGSIAGGAETFFGKNKGRTIDAKLKKWTAVVAVLFLVTSIGLNIVLQAEKNANEKAIAEQAAKAAEEVAAEETEAPAEAEAVTADEAPVEEEAAETEEAAE